ncbi:MAG: alpha/beta hydrolase, partial [Woeseiaceae bacterium]|nr:alpha/beta hydrolase [Woeseiaceae bacterium]
LAIIVDKQAVLSGHADLSGGDIDHDFGTASLTDLVISVFEDELLEELRVNGEQQIADEIAALNFRLDGRDENGQPDPTIEAFNGPTTFVLEVSDEDQPVVRQLLAQYGIPDIVIAMLDERGIEVLLQLAVLDGAERDAYLAQLGAVASCEVLLTAFAAPLERVPLYTLDAQGCSVAGAGSGGSFFTDASCSVPVAFRATGDTEFCAARFGDGAESVLGNAAAWAADAAQPNDPLPGQRSQAWTTTAATTLDLGAVPLSGNYQPYMKKVAYRSVGDLSRGTGVCELEMRVYKEDLASQNLVPVIALHGGTWQHRGFSFLGLEAGISQLTARGLIVFAPFYRLVGESDGNVECNAATWREVTADVESALDWVRDYGPSLGAANGPVNVYGQSAGAHLAAWLAAKRPDDVRKALLFYGPLDAVEFLDGALPSGGRYADFRDFGLRSLNRFFGATDLQSQLRLDRIDFSTTSVETLSDDWEATIPDDIVDFSAVDPFDPPPFMLRCANDTQTDLASIDPAAPPAALVDCLKQDVRDFLVDNSFAHQLQSEKVPVHAVHGTADALIPYEQPLHVCGAIDDIELPGEVFSPLTTYACGLSSEVQIIDGADHALELGVCLASICPAGEPGSATRSGVETAVPVAFDWLLAAPVTPVDSDGDGIYDHRDAFPQDPTEWVDTDADGVGDNADRDDDGDGRLDAADAFPSNADEFLDSDGDGVGNNADPDDDGDGVPDGSDNCPVFPNPAQLDSSGYGIGDEGPALLVSAAAVADFRCDGVDEMAALFGDRASGEHRAQVRSGADGGLLLEIAFGTEVVDLVAVLGDVAGAGTEALATIGYQRSGDTELKLFDPASGDLLALANLPVGHSPLDMTAMPDTDGNGAAEIAILVRRDSDGRAGVQMHDVSDLDDPWYVWFAPNHDALAVAAIPRDTDGDGVAELAVLLERASDGRGRVEIRNASGSPNPRSLWFWLGIDVGDLLVLDAADPLEPPRIAVLGTRISDGRILVQLVSALDDADRGNLWYGADGSALGFASVDDADGNGSPEIAVLVVRASDGRLRIQTRNVTGPVNGNTVWYPPAFTGNALVIHDDLDGNGSDEGGVFMVRDSDGRITLQLRNLSGTPLPRNNWFQ